MKNLIARPVKKEDDGEKIDYHKAVVAAKVRHVKAVSARSELEEAEQLIKNRLAAAKAEETAALQGLRCAEHAEHQGKLACAKRALDDAEKSLDVKRQKLSEAVTANQAASEKRRGATKTAEVATKAAETAQAAAEATLDNHTKQRHVLRKAAKSVLRPTWSRSSSPVATAPATRRWGTPSLHLRAKMF